MPGMQQQYEDLLKTVVDDEDLKQRMFTTTEKIKATNKAPDVQAWRYFKWRFLLVIWLAISMFLTLKVDSFILGYGSESIYIWVIVFPIIAIITVLPTFCFYAYLRSLTLETDIKADPNDIRKYVEFTDPSSKELFGGDLTQKASMHLFHEAYFDCKLDIKGNVIDAIENLHKFVHYRMNWSLIKIFLTNFVPELLIHSRAQDRAQVQDHYNRGNDFFRAFLGPMMIYTGAVFDNLNESLEDGQTRKLNIVCKKTHMKPGMEHLDLGCGWGTLVAHAARYYGTKSRGVTLAKEQVAWGKAQLAREPYNQRDKGSDGQFFVCDYRDTDIYAPNKKKFGAITCLEMSEHVGVKYYQSFLCQVYDMLEDDGLFYLQIAGLRRAWTFHDFVWGLFMDKYIFPGADASAPIFVVANELEKAGFEIHSVENIGIHYSNTIYRWYLNWCKNKTYILKTYGERWYRIWVIFLAWSMSISRAGRSTAYQIICHKNTSEFDRSIFVGEQKMNFHQNPTKTPF